MNRRNFIKNAAVLFALKDANFNKLAISKVNELKSIQVVRTDSDFEREKLIRPFGIKGGYLTELWQTASMLESKSGNKKIGLATQSVLYGDEELFASHSEAGGNALMYGLTNKALQLVKATTFKTPIELLERILPELTMEGYKMTGKKNLNLNFVLNSLISVDNAAWLLYAADNDLKNFDAIIPDQYKQALSYRNDKIAVMYSISYGLPIQQVINAVEKGYFVIKIKSGQPGTQSEMLQKDMARLSEIHNALKNARTNQTKNGKLIYTIDPNGRYAKKETLLKFLDHAKKIGAYEQILFIEEPFPDSNNENVSDVGISIAADESVHNENDALRRLDQGYGALVLKGIAKTLSLSMKIARLAHERGVPCLCADLTVNPILVDWHKNLAARVAPFPELEMGIMETNGDLNYKNWQNMQNYHSAAGAPWTYVENGVFKLNKDFYQRSGGIFEPSRHYHDKFNI